MHMHIIIIFMLSLLTYCLQISMNVKQMLLAVSIVALIFIVVTTAHVKMDMHFHVMVTAV